MELIGLNAKRATLKAWENLSGLCESFSFFSVLLINIIVTRHLFLSAKKLQEI